MRPVGSVPLSLSAVERGLAHFDRAATRLAGIATSPDAAVDAVTLSTSARTASAATHETRNALTATDDVGSPASTDFAQSSVDLRVSKYVTIANLKVLKTEDELNQTVDALKRVAVAP
jgi:hypothetical protein